MGYPVPPPPLRRIEFVPAIPVGYGPTEATDHTETDSIDSDEVFGPAGEVFEV